MRSLLALALLYTCLISASASSFSFRNANPSQWNLYRIESGPGMLIAAGDAGVMIKSTNGGKTWNQIPSGLDIAGALTEDLNFPGFAIHDLHYDAGADQWTGIVFNYANANCYTWQALYAIGDAPFFTDSTLSHQAILEMQEAPVYGNGKWVGMSLASPTPLIYTAAEPAGPWFRSNINLDCNCAVQSSPKWSDTLQAFVLLLDRKIATSTDGVNYTSIMSLSYPPGNYSYPYPNMDQMFHVLPLFADPILVYYSYVQNQTLQVTVNFANPKQPILSAVPIDFDYYNIIFLHYQNGLFLRGRGGSHLHLEFSADSLTWQSVSEHPKHMNDATYDGNGNFFIVADNGEVSMLSNGSSSWTQLTTLGDLQGSWSGWVTWVDGSKPTFYAAGNPFIEDQAGPIISTDGVHFSGMPINAPGPYPYPTQITYVPSADQYVMIIANGHVVITSSDGFKKQTNYTIPKTDNSHPVAESICTGNPPAIVVPTSRLSGTTAMTLISTDHGKKWQLVQDEQPSAPLEACAYGNGVYVGMTSPNISMWYSNNGIFWNQSASTFNNIELRSLRFLNGWFVAVGDVGTVAFSKTGETWQTVNICPEALNGVSYVNGAWVAVGEAGVVYSTTNSNLAGWTLQDVGVYTSLSDIAWSPSLNVTVIVGGGGIILST